MQQFINNIVQFIHSILEGFRNAFFNISIPVGETFSNFLNKNIFYDSSLIGINITYIELLRYVFPIIIVILFIVLFVKFVLKLVSIFRV